jgi:hypothetical protein
MMMLEDLRLALRQICRAIGLPAEAATVVSLIVLGVALNFTALRAVEYVGIGGHACHDQTGLQSAAQTEVKVVRAVVVLTLKKMGDGARRLCSARQWMIGKPTEGTGYHFEVGVAPGAHTCRPGCDGTLEYSPSRKIAIAFVQC